MEILIKQIETASWILNEDGEFECTHDNDVSVEVGETWPTSPMDNGHEFRYYWCNDCDSEVDGDPDADRADALADAQIMEALGK